MQRAIEVNANGLHVKQEGTISMKKLLLGAVVLGALGAGQSAYATPYGFANTTFNDFLITLGPDASITGGAVSVTTSQNYPGSANTGGTVTQTFTGTGFGGILGAPVAAPYAYGGPNQTYGSSPPPPATTATPSPIGQTSLQGGYGAQAAESVGPLSPFTGPGDGAAGAVENGGVFGGGSVTATASQNENVYTLTTGAVPTSVTVSFSAQVFAEALTALAGETASASTNNTLTIGICTTPACSLVIDATTIAPPQFQLAVSAGPVSAGGEAAGDPAVFLPFTQTLALLPNETYELTFVSTQTESTSTLPGIPEPASLTLLGSGVLGLAAVIRRRRKV